LAVTVGSGSAGAEEVVSSGGGVSEELEILKFWYCI